MQSSTPPLSYVLPFLLTKFFSFSWSRPALDSCCFMLTHVGVVLTRVRLLLTRVNSCWLVSDSCWLVLDLCQTRVDLCWLMLTHIWLVLTCVDSCWLVLVLVLDPILYTTREKTYHCENFGRKSLLLTIKQYFFWKFEIMQWSGIISKDF